jgi:glucose-1-phosphate thymidylyltransferase
MRGVILAGGLGTRLQPITRQINKHLVPILNKPMVQYPLETLKAFGVTEILIVTGGGHVGGFAEFFEDGSDYGVNLTYLAQKKAGGIAQALSLAEDFAHGEQITVILGDNIFGHVDTPHPLSTEACIFVTPDVFDKSRFGVYRIAGGNPQIIEKPNRIMDWDMVVTGLYIYPPDVFDVIRQMKPSARGEYEITDVNDYYLKRHRLAVIPLAADCFWSDAGVPESLYRAIRYVAKKEGLDS